MYFGTHNSKAKHMSTPSFHNPLFFYSCLETNFVNMPKSTGFSHFKCCGSMIFIMGHLKSIVFAEVHKHSPVIPTHQKNNFYYLG